MRKKKRTKRKGEKGNDVRQLGGNDTDHRLLRPKQLPTADLAQFGLELILFVTVPGQKAESGSE